MGPLLNVRVFILKWGADQRRVASFARLDSLITHYLENVKNHGENRRFPHNRLLRVRAVPASDAKLEAAEIEKLMEVGMMKRVEAA